MLKKHFIELPKLPRDDRSYYEGFLRKNKTILMTVMDKYFDKEESDVLKKDLRRLTEK